MLDGVFQNSPFLIYAIPMALIWLGYHFRQYLQHHRAVTARKAMLDSGLSEPSSLHPVIDPNACLGCGACTRACPEGEILGLIRGKAQLLQPSNCIGHGACKTACPVDAISLVFGTENRGIDIPVLKPNFETTVPGIYIAGELGGMGLIRNAIEQGKQAVGEIRSDLTNQTISTRSSSLLDLVIVGAGPAGIAGSLMAKASKLNFITIDQDSLGGTVSHFPRGKIVMTAPVDLPLIGKVKMRETSKEALLEFWQKILADTKLTIQFGERLEGVTQGVEHFLVKTSSSEYCARAVLLCIGRRGSPRKLGVVGEDLPKVVYRLIDPAQYKNQHVLIVGGGDSALEAAISIAEESGTTVTLSYRGDSFSRAKAKNRERINQSNQEKRVNILLCSTVRNIDKNSIQVETEQEVQTLQNDAVIVCVGGVLPTPFLKEIGISVETKYGSA